MIFACVVKAAKRTSAVRAAEPIANPLPIAAVVLPTASNLSGYPQHIWVIFSASPDSMPLKHFSKLEIP